MKLGKNLQGILITAVVICLMTAGCGQKEQQEEVVVEASSSETIATTMRQTTTVETEEQATSSKQEIITTEAPIQTAKVEDTQFIVDASSIYSEDRQGKRYIYSPENMTDEDLTTAWVEDAEGPGVGEWLIFTYDEPISLESISLINGYSKSEALYNKNARVKSIRVTSMEGDEKVISFDDGVLDLQEAEVGFGAVSGFKFTVEEVYEGSKYEDLCVSELRINDVIPSVMLSDSNEETIQALNMAFEAEAKKASPVGHYDASVALGGFYDEHMNLLEAFDEMRWGAQMTPGFALLEGGVVTSNGGAATYQSGHWHMEGDILIVTTDYAEQVQYTVRGNLLLKKLSTAEREEYQMHYDFVNDYHGEIYYLAYGKEALRSWDAVGND